MVKVKRSMPAPESLEREKNKASGSYENGCSREIEKKFP